MKLKDAQAKAYEMAVLRGVCCYIAGAGGTGKTFTVKLIIERLFRMRLGVLVSAFTGTAAKRASVSEERLRGHTLHSLFKFKMMKRDFDKTPHYIDDRFTGKEEEEEEGFEEEEVGSAGNGRYLTARITQTTYSLLSKLHVLVIDEISMLQPDAMEVIERVLRFVKGRPRKLFGGVQVICVGDFAQLPPIKPRRDRRDKAEFVFEMALWTRFMQPIVLSEVVRQKDREDVALLSKMRDGRMTYDDCETLVKMSYRRNGSGSTKPMLTLCAKRDKCNIINSNEFRLLGGPANLYKPDCTLVTVNTEPRRTHLHVEHAQARMPYHQFEFPTCDFVELKVGTRVQCVRNIYQRSDDGSVACAASGARGRGRGGEEGEIPEGVEIDAARLREDSIYNVPTPQRVLSNGMLGTVTILHSETVCVEWDDLPGMPMPMPRSWKRKTQGFQCDSYEGGPYGVVCKASYLAIAQASAVTFHKAQGMTAHGRLDVDIESWHGCYGGGYTAVSRATELANVRFINSTPQPGHFQCHPKVKAYHRKLFG